MSEIFKKKLRRFILDQIAEARRAEDTYADLSPAGAMERVAQGSFPRIPTTASPKSTGVSTMSGTDFVGKKIANAIQGKNWATPQMLRVLKKTLATEADPATEGHATKSEQALLDRILEMIQQLVPQMQTMDHFETMKALQSAIKMILRESRVKKNTLHEALPATGGKIAWQCSICKKPDVPVGVEVAHGICEPCSKKLDVDHDGLMSLDDIISGTGSTKMKEAKYSLLEILSDVNCDCGICLYCNGLTLSSNEDYDPENEINAGIPTDEDGIQQREKITTNLRILKQSKVKKK